MTSIKKDDKNRRHGIGPLAAAVTGAVIGVGAIAAVGGAVALRDKKTQEKVKKVLGDVKDQAVSYMEDMQKTTDKKKAVTLTSKAKKPLPKPSK